MIVLRKQNETIWISLREFSGVIHVYDSVYVAGLFS